MRQALFVLTIVAPLAALAFVACGRSTGGRPTPVTRALATGESIGRVERATSGTPQSGMRTLLSVDCKNGRLSVRTNADEITADDDCSAPIFQAKLDQLLGVPVIITDAGDHLVIESAVGGVKLELPGRNATIGAVHGAP